MSFGGIKVFRRGKYIIFVLWALSLSGLTCAEQLPTGLRIVKNDQAIIRADLGKVVRDQVPPALFSFNMNWVTFQNAFAPEGKVMPEVIDLLHYFPGAMYRYPGGGLSNMYEYKKGIGPIASRQPQISHANKPAIAKFGTEEYLNFVKGVGGEPLLQANLSGPGKEEASDKDVMENALGWERLIEKSADFAPSSGCTAEQSCPDYWWELGNELDYSGKWSTEKYIKRAEEVGLALKKQDPDVGLMPLTATAVFDSHKGGMFRADFFNQAVLQATSGWADGYAVHAYYDGMPIDRWLGYLTKLVGMIHEAAGSRSPVLFITEHSTFDNIGKLGKGRPQILSGALSTADFLIGILQIPEIQGAMYHVLGGEGPWRLFTRYDDRVVPSAPYWALRVLRNGALDEVVQTITESPNYSDYRGGYDLRGVVTRSKVPGKFSLLIVNRSEGSQDVNFVLTGVKPGKWRTNVYSLSGSDINERNSEYSPEQLKMQSSMTNTVFDSRHTAHIKVPGYSVVAYVFTQ